MTTTDPAARLTAPAPEPTVCQWCGHPIPAATAPMWDGRPQCPDPIACTRRIPRKEQP